MLKRNLNVYLEDFNGVFFKIPVYPDVSFSQVFSEKTLGKKTLHNPEKLIKGGITTELNTGNFSFTYPLMDATTARTFAQSLLVTPTAQTIFFENEGVIKKLNKCVVESVVFNTAKNMITTVSVSGSYSNSETASLPPTSVTDLGSIYTYIQGIEITEGANVLTNVFSFNIELSNSVTWLPNKTMHDLVPTSRENFVCDSRTINGNISVNTDMSDPSYNDSRYFKVRIKSNEDIFLEFEFPSVIITSRNQLDTVVKKGYDFRVNENTNNIIKYKGVNVI